MRTLGRRALNRALLARNLLLDRQAMPVVDAVEHLVGLQAQAPLEPYTGLWSRLRDFDPFELARLLEERMLVRTLLMRRTLHLVSARDCLALRGVHDEMLRARMLGTLRTRLMGVDLAELAAAGTELFGRHALTLGEAGRALADRWPKTPTRDLGDALSTLVPLVQVPPRGVWGQTAPARNAAMAAWLGCPPAADTAPDTLVLRYLAAFGPAASSDVRARSGLSGLPAAIARLRPRLRTFRDERGRELLDVPGAPLPDPDTPAPPRFLPAFDNAVLGYDDRSRIIDDAHRGLSVEGARFMLIDGRVAATWTVSKDGTLEIAQLVPVSGRERDAATEQAVGLLQFLLPDGKRGRVSWHDRSPCRS